MWLVSSRDLRWRSRRFLISVVATGLAFGLTLVMTGVTAHMRNSGCGSMKKRRKHKTNFMLVEAAFHGLDRSGCVGA